MSSKLADKLAFACYHLSRTTLLSWRTYHAAACPCVSWSDDQLDTLGEDVDAETLLRRYQRSNNTADAIALAIRLGCIMSIERDFTNATDLLQRITSPGNPLNAPHKIQVQALSLLVQFYLWKHQYLVLAKTPNLELLKSAARFANDAASLGFASYITMRLASFLKAEGLGAEPVRDSASPYDEATHAYIADMSYLWNAYAKYLAFRAGQDTAPGVPESSSYCAAEGCGIEATDRFELKRCSGPCSLEVKPHYCSTQCQREDWKARHKYACRADAPTVTTTTRTRGVAPRTAAEFLQQIRANRVVPTDPPPSSVPTNFIGRRPCPEPIADRLITMGKPQTTSAYPHPVGFNLVVMSLNADDEIMEVFGESLLNQQVNGQTLIQNYDPFDTLVCNIRPAPERPDAEGFDVMTVPSFYV